MGLLQFFCHACGIATTSQANLEDHMRGRKHARRVQHLHRHALAHGNETVPRGRNGELKCPAALLVHAR